MGELRNISLFLVASYQVVGLQVFRRGKVSFLRGPTTRGGYSFSSGYVSRGQRSGPSCLCYSYRVLWVYDHSLSSFSQEGLCAPGGATTSHTSFSFLRFASQGQFSGGLVPSQVVVGRIVRYMGSSFFRRFLHFFTCAFSYSGSYFFARLYLSPGRGGQGAFPGYPNLFLVLVRCYYSISLLAIPLVRRGMRGDELTIRQGMRRRLRPSVGLRSPIRDSLRSPPMRPSRGAS